MIIVTGTAGFIGSNLVTELFKKGYQNIICVDLPGKNESSAYLKDKNVKFVPHSELDGFIHKNHHFVETVIHLGACSDTTETDEEYIRMINIDFSKKLWSRCSQHGIPYIYASSAATYGDGQNGYNDSHDIVTQLNPLNLYGWSKNEFDKWVLKQDSAPSFWAGLKFFNVYGPNEDHKNGQASVIKHAFSQIQENGKVSLFKSHRKDIMDGEQSRDFIYVKDVCDVIIFFMEERRNSGIFNVGTGKSRSFKDLALSTFCALNLEPSINFIDTPKKLRGKYQYYTKANISKLRKAGYTKPFTDLETGVNEYVNDFLVEKKFN